MSHGATTLYRAHNEIINFRWLESRQLWSCTFADDGSVSGPDSGMHLRADCLFMALAIEFGVTLSVSTKCLVEPISAYCKPMHSWQRITISRHNRLVALCGLTCGVLCTIERVGDYHSGRAGRGLLLIGAGTSHERRVTSHELGTTGAAVGFAGDGIKHSDQVVDVQVTISAAGRGVQIVDGHAFTSG